MDIADIFPSGAFNQLRNLLIGGIIRQYDFQVPEGLHTDGFQKPFYLCRIIISRDAYGNFRYVHRPSSRSVFFQPLIFRKTRFAKWPVLKINLRIPPSMWRSPFFTGGSSFRIRKEYSS